MKTLFIFVTSFYMASSFAYVPDENHPPDKEMQQRQEAREEAIEQAPLHSGRKIDMKKKPTKKDVNYNSINKNLMENVSPNSP